MQTNCIVMARKDLFQKPFDEGTISKGSHECQCGAESLNYDYEIAPGYYTNSLAAHYLEFHRSEVPEKEFDKIDKMLSSLESEEEKEKSKEKSKEKKKEKTTVVCLKGQKNQELEDDQVYIGRHLRMGGWDLPESPYMNRFKGRNPVASYYHWLMKEENEKLRKTIKKNLTGKKLACFCK